MKIIVKGIDAATRYAEYLERNYYDFTIQQETEDYLFLIVINY